MYVPEEYQAKETFKDLQTDNREFFKIWSDPRNKLNQEHMGALYTGYLAMKTFKTPTSVSPIYGSIFIIYCFLKSVQKYRLLKFFHEFDLQ